MYKLTVCYGHPDDPAAFDEHYYSVHLPLTKKMPGLIGITVGKCDSPDGTESPPYYLVAEVYAPSQQALLDALASPEGQVASADTPNFATGGSTVSMYPVEEIVLVQRG